MNTNPSNGPATSSSNGSKLQTTTGTGHDAAERGRELANNTFDHLASAIETARSTTVPAIERLTSKAETMAQRSIELARTGSQQLRDQALLASEVTAGYVKQSPVKSLLLAAAAGALLTMIFSSGKRDRS